MPSHERDAAGAAGPAILARGLVRRYGPVTAVDGVDLEVPAGTIFGFIGPSGSGKSTTVRLLSGGERPDAGTVRVLDGGPAAFSAEQRRRIGYMPQLSVLFPTLSIRENLSFVASIYGMPLLRRRPRMRATLEFVELYDDRRTRLANASGGMQRRLALAAALVHRPDILFLDEPTAGVDPVLRRKFWDHFTHLRNDGRTLFVTTQYVTEAGYCDLAAVLSKGRVLAVDTPAGLRRRAFGGDLLDVLTDDALDDEARRRLGGVRGVYEVVPTSRDGRDHRLVVEDADRALPAVRQWLQDHRIRVDSVRPHVPSFDDVFVALVEADPR